MENAVGNSKIKQTLRYCRITSCENNRGTVDVTIFRVPPKERDAWMMNLFGQSEDKVNVNKMYVPTVCQWHFKPEDIRIVKRGDKVNYQLKPGTLPRPIHEIYRNTMPTKAEPVQSATSIIIDENSSVKPEYFECFICKWKKTKNAATMCKHMNKHSLRNYSKCKVCNTQSETVSHLCGKNAEDVQCEYCMKRFKSTAKMQQHLDEMHKSNCCIYRCDKCPKYFVMASFRDCHQATHSENFECDVCQKKFATAECRFQHMRRHNFQKSILCDLCGKAFATARQLKQHKKSAIHSEPTIECALCPKKFFRQQELIRHSEKHNSNNYMCELCGKGFPSVHRHRLHMKRHNRTEADRRFACNFCSMKFFNSTNLKSHVNKHFEVKKFHCRMCDQSFKYNGDLNKHLRTHFDDGKIYECSECEMRFKYLTELEKHSFEHCIEGKAVNVGGDRNESGI